MTLDEAKQVLAREVDSRAAGWDKRLESACLVVLGGGDVAKGREMLVALAQAVLEASRPR
jgi:hypothetical protein